jgi:hypothetical protein
VHDAGRRRHHAEVLERLGAPLEELVALAVALELELRVEAEGLRRAEESTCTEWSITRSQGTSGLTFFTSPAEALHRRAQGGEVDHAGHPREVLQHHTAGVEGDLAVADRLRVVLHQRLDVRLGEDEVVEVTQARLEQHLDAVRQRIDRAEAAQGIETVHGSLAEQSVELGSRGERVTLGGGHWGGEAYQIRIGR